MFYAINFKKLLNLTIPIMQLISKVFYIEIVIEKVGNTTIYIVIMTVFLRTILQKRHIQPFLVTNSKIRLFLLKFL